MSKLGVFGCRFAASDNLGVGLHQTKHFSLGRERFVLDHSSEGLLMSLLDQEDEVAQFLVESSCGFMVELVQSLCNGAGLRQGALRNLEEFEIGLIQGFF